ncbi:MAG: hypothetical protein LBL61_03625 [Elusimicrobiota bacterium]|jgi:hypothetical protein|nr:hypothetical protein [Elusimicrobiota bacterium]
MKKLIIAAFVMCLAGGVYAANQQCFYGKNCVDGKLVKEYRVRHMHKHPGFMRHAHKMHKTGWMKDARPCKEEGKCAAVKEGKPCGCKKIRENKKGRADCGCKEQGKPCACKKDKRGFKNKKHAGGDAKFRGEDNK